MVLNQTTKYGLIFAGGLILGALGAVALAKGKKAGGIKPLASSLLSAGMDVKDKVMTGIDGVREELADVVAEAQVKSQMRREPRKRRNCCLLYGKARRSARWVVASASGF